MPAKSDPSTPANAPQGNNQSSGPAGPAVAELPKVAATGANAVAAGAVSEVKAPRTEPAALETTSPSPLATGSDSDTSAAKSSTDKTLPNSDGKAAEGTKGAEEARIPDYKLSAALVRAQQYIRGTGGVGQNC